MFKTKKTRVIGLALVTALILVGAVYATAAWAAPNPTGTSTAATTAGTTSTATATDTAQLRATILEMLKDHMGLTGADAEKWADQMISRMQQCQGDDFSTMIEQCEQYMDGAAPGQGACGSGRGGMMGGNGNGMMGGARW
jgi:hypothetical protein